MDVICDDTVNSKYFGTLCTEDNLFDFNFFLKFSILIYFNIITIINCYEISMHKFGGMITDNICGSNSELVFKRKNVKNTTST